MYLMEFVFRPMDDSSAKAMAEWNYVGPLALCDMEKDQDDLCELLDSGNWIDRYYAVADRDDGLVAFFCFEEEGGSVVAGSGLKPEYTGRGLGRAFVEVGPTAPRLKCG